MRNSTLPKRRPWVLSAASAVRVLAQCLADTRALVAACERAGDAETARSFRAQAVAYRKDLARWKARLQKQTGGYDAFSKV